MNQEYNFKIGNREIGPGNPVFIVAEMSANHNQDLEKAKEIIKTAYECGADAVKLQTYTPDTLTIDCSKESFVVKGSNPDWQGMTLYQLYKKAYMPWDWQPKLKKIAEELGLILFSTAYDETAVDFLEKMNVPAYKIASFELNDIELLKKIASTKKPVIISKGMASLEETEMALSILRENGASGIALLHCVSSYPAELEDMNLATIPDIEKRFKIVPGLSDHSLGISAAIASVAFGACVIEKHFTLRRADGGPDSSFSLEPQELKQLVKSVRETEKAIGKIHYGPIKGECLLARRSIFAIQDIKAGQEFSRENVRSIRPGYGLAPKFLPEILGQKALKDIERGAPLHMADAIIFLQGDKLDRVPKILSLYQQGFSDKIVITGNNEQVEEFKDSYLSEIKKYFLSQGVPEKDIIMDNKALNTLDQAINVIKMAKEKKWKRLIVVTSPYHSLRAYLTFTKQIKDQNWDGSITIQVPDDLPIDNKKLSLEMEKIKKYKLK